MGESLFPALNQEKSLRRGKMFPSKSKENLSTAKCRARHCRSSVVTFAVYYKACQVRYGYEEIMPRTIKATKYVLVSLPTHTFNELFPRCLQTLSKQLAQHRNLPDHFLTSCQNLCRSCGGDEQGGGTSCELKTRKNNKKY